MDKKKSLLLAIMLLFGLQLTGCYWHHWDWDHDERHGDGYYHEYGRYHSYYGMPDPEHGHHMGR